MAANKKRGAPAFFDESDYDVEESSPAIDISGKSVIFEEKMSGPVLFENKTVRAELRCRPSTIEKARKYVNQQKLTGNSKMSFNELVNQLLEEFLEKEAL